jgi:hypothetical protein
LAAVDVQDLAGHERRRLEIEDSSDHVLDLADSADGVQRAHPRVQEAGDVDGDQRVEVVEGVVREGLTATAS